MFLLETGAWESRPPVREKAPESKFSGTMITPALATALIIDKHCDHLPHYRQSQRSFREQIVELRSLNLLQIDETPMPYLIPGTGKADKGYLWVMRKKKGLSWVCPLVGKMLVVISALPNMAR